MKIILTILFGLLICIAPQISSARSAHYILAQQKTPEKRIVARLINRDNGATIWTRNVLGVGLVKWSYSHKAMAASFESSSGFRILVWQQGKPVYEITESMASIIWGYSDDGVLDFVWSPDERRLLFRPWGSGEKDMGIAKLYCLDVSNRKISFVAGNVRKI